MTITKRSGPLGLLFKAGGIILLFVTLLSPHTLAPIVAQGTPDIIREFAWKPDGSVLAVGHDDGTIDIRNSSTGIVEQTLAGGHVGGIVALAWHPTDAQLVSASADRFILWDLLTNHSYELTSAEWIEAATWNADASRIIGFATTGQFTWDAQTLPPQLLLSEGGDLAIHAIAWGPNRNQVATTDLGDIILRNPSTLAREAIIGNGGNGELAWSPDGQWLAASNWVNGLRMWNVSTGDFQQERLIQVPLYDAPQLHDPFRDIKAIHFGASGTELFSITGYGNFTRWDVTTGQVLESLQLSGTPIYKAAFSPDGTQIAYGLESGGVEIIDTPSPSNCTSTIVAGDVPSLAAPILLARWSSVTADTIGLTDGEFAGIYDSDFSLIQSFTLPPIPSPSQIFFQASVWSPDLNYVHRVVLYDDTYTGPSPDKATLQVWRVNTQQLVFEYFGLSIHSGVTWNQQSTRLAFAIPTGLGSDNLLIFDTAGNQIAELTPPVSGLIDRIAWNSDGNLIAFNTNSNLHIWDFALNQYLASPTNSFEFESSLYFSAISNQLAYVEYIDNLDSETISIWDPDTSQEVGQLLGHQGMIFTFDWQADRIASVGLDGTVRIWNSQTFQQVAEYPQGFITQVQLSPDSNTLLTNGPDPSTYQTVDPLTGQVLSANYCAITAANVTADPDTFNPMARSTPASSVIGQESRIYDFAWSPDGSRIAVACSAGLAQILNATTLPVLVALQPPQVSVLAWSPSGNRLAVGKSDGTVQIQDGVTGQLVRILVGHTGRIADLGWSMDEDKLVSASKDKTVRVWNTNSGEMLKTIVAPKDAIKAVIWGHDPNNVIGVDNAEISDLFVWDVITGALLQQFPEGTVSQIVRSPDGTRLAFANPGGDVALRDGDTLDFIAYWQQPEMTGRGLDVYQVAWSPDNSRLATGSLNGTVRVWNAGTSNPRGEILLTLQANDSQEIGPTTTMLRALAFTSNGRLLSSFSADGTIRVWNAISGQVLNSTQVLTPVYAAAFSPDGSKLAYGDASGAVQIIPTPLCNFTIAAGDVAGPISATNAANVSADPDTLGTAAKLPILVLKKCWEYWLIRCSGS